MTPPTFTLSTGKTIATDEIKFDLISDDESKGDYRYIFVDGTEIYLTWTEVKELCALQEEWRRAGMYNIEPRPEMRERVETDLDASAFQALLDERAYANGHSYIQEPKIVRCGSGLVTDEERTD